MSSDAMVTAAEFRRLIGIGRRTFQTWRAAGKLPPPDFAPTQRTVRWRRETVERYLGQHQALRKAS